jgi:two-component system phosphate regulon sensor histidine kinase PhoR
VHLWWIAGTLLALAGALVVLRLWVSPWRDLEQLLSIIARGGQPRTFLLTGNGRARRVGVALEQLLMRQQQLDRQVSQDAAQMRAVFAALTDGLLVVDSARHITFCNPAFEQLYGDRKVAPGTPLLDIVRDVDVVDPIQSALEAAKPRAAEISSPDQKRHLQLIAVPIVNEGQEASGVVALFHDISRLKQVDQVRRDFVANVSHELRTPLSIFRGNLETLLEANDLEPTETRHIYGVMKRHSDRLNLLVDDLLSLARLEAKEATLQLEWIDVAEFLNHVTRDWAKRCAQKELHLDLTVPGTLPLLRADRMRLEEIVHNLLDNAVKYSHRGGPIAISVVARDSEVALSVIDRGIGIPASELPRIFERFYRVDRARSRELGGTGLGLSIVKHIAQLHGGRVEANSAIDEGTAISVVLPIAGPAVTQS